MRTFVQQGLFAVAFATVALACGGSEPPARSPEAEATASTPNSADLSMSGRPGGGTPQAAPPPVGPEPQGGGMPAAATPPPAEGESPVLARSGKPLADGEVIGVLLTANNGETMVADFALRKLTADDAKQFAAMMKSHHATALQKVKTVQTKLKAESADTDLAAFFKKDGEDTVKDLRDKEGAPFDRAYMASQVKAHRALLTAIDNRLVPSATNGELKTLVTETRRQVADHLTRAEDIHKKMGASASTTTTQPRVESRATSGLGLAGPNEPMPPHPAGKHATQAKARTAADVPSTTAKQPPTDPQH